MRINLGKYKGKSVELIMLKEPKHVKWVLEQLNLSGPLLSVKNEILRLMTIFNQKPIINRCAGRNCNNAATRASLYKDNVIPMWWCDDCDPYLLVYQVRFQIIATYEEALTHVKAYCEGRKSDYNFLIRAFARAKGLPKRVSEKEIQTFFHEIQLW